MARFAFTEEWLSLRASHILPILTRNHEIHYIASGKEKPDGDFASVTMFSFPRYQLQNSLAISRTARRLYQRGEIDFVVDYSYMAFLLSTIPFIEIVGGLYVKGFEEKLQSAAWYQYPRLALGYLHYCLPEKVAIRRARRIITDNSINAEYMAQNYSVCREDIAVVPNGVDRKFTELFDDKAYNPQHLLFVGALHAGKGILPVLEEFCARPELDVEFTICGDGPLRAQVEHLAQRDNRIRYRGRVAQADLLEIQKKTTIFVFPSFAEGCPNALLEAMAAGHACVTYEEKTVTAVIADSGLIVERGNVRHLMDQVQSLVLAPALVQSLASAAHTRSHQFSWQETAARFEAIIQKMPGEKT